jgi:polysaccharide deacetylase 2 family uncharacterized protein YibQ
LPPEKRNKTGKAKGGRKADPAKSGRAGAKKRPPTSVLIAWVLALVLLSSLIYLGKEARRLPAPSADLPAQKAKNGPGSQASDEAGAKPGKLLDRPPAQRHSESRTESSSSPNYNPVEPPPPRDVPLVALAPRPAPPRDVPSAAPAPRPAPPSPDISPKAARVSIVIDDLGLDVGIAKKFASLPFPVTFSVLPHQAHSSEIAELAHLKGLEVILHLPMEPLNPKENPGRGALLLSMSGDEIRRNIRAALDTSPYFDGANNHMGSRMTRDAEMMKTVLWELKVRELFFLDSMTTDGSKGWKIARELKMPSLKRDIFLDDNPSAVAVRSQITRLVRIAKVKGTALAIGHPRAATLKSLQDAAGYFREEGIEIVPARDLAGR